VDPTGVFTPNDRLLLLRLAARMTKMTKKIKKENQQFYIASRV